jgi:hypothetical protein
MDMDMEQVHKRAVEILGDPNVAPSQAQLAELAAIKSDAATASTQSTGYIPYTDEVQTFKREFNEPLYNLVQDGSFIELTATQTIVRNLLSPTKSPYTGLLLYHKTGVGKTLTGVTVAEQFLESNRSHTVIMMGRPSIQENFKAIVPETNLERYIFMGFSQFYNWIVGMVADQQDEDIIVQIFWTKFADTLFVVDEAHNLRDYDKEEKESLELEEDKDGKEDKAYSVLTYLTRILQSAPNTKLLLMTATPVYNLASDALDLINLLRANDKKTPVDPNTVFDSSGAALKKGKQSLFRSLCKGYVSFMSADDPSNYPIKIWPAIATPIYDGMQIVPIDMTAEQRAYYPMKASITEQLQTLNIAFSLKTFQDTFRETSNGSTVYEYAQESTVDIFSHMDKYCPKIQSIVDSVSKGDGPVVIYSRFVMRGIVPVAMALEKRGFVRVDGRPLLHQSADKTKHGYVIITANSVLTPNMAESIKMVTHRDHSVKAILLSDRGTEGLDLKNVRQVHILDPWYHVSKLEQIIGRAARFKSHMTLPEPKRNVTVFLYSCVASDMETADQRAYSITDSKRVGASQVDSILRENAVDCEMTQFRRDQMLFARTEHVKKTITDCFGQNVNGEAQSFMELAAVAPHKCQTAGRKSNIDDSTFDVTVHAFYEKTLIHMLSGVFHENQSPSVEIAVLLRDIGVEEDVFDYIVCKMIDTQTDVVHPLDVNFKGTLVRRGRFLKFQPLHNTSKYLTDSDRMVIGDPNTALKKTMLYD